jgi:hypothetical protein
MDSKKRSNLSTNITGLKPKRRKVVIGSNEFLNAVWKTWNVQKD